MTVSSQLTSSSTTTRQPYLGVIGHFVNGQAIAQLPTGTLVSDRFQVIAPHLWKDTKPDGPLERGIALPFQVTPYLKLYPYRLHLPEVYGILQPERLGDSTVLLLDNIPVTLSGDLLPSITDAWESASPTRQLNWLWQMGQLWSVLFDEGVASSLLTPENIRVEGWRIHLRELLFDGVSAGSGAEPSGQSDHAVSRALDSSLNALGQVWMAWSETAHSTIQDDIQAIAQALHQPNATWNDVAPAINTALLYQVAQMPLNLTIAGGTSAGTGRSPNPSLNEDACYPITLSINGTTVDKADELKPRVAIVCDGIGGHAGGEVASHLTIRALKLQLRALFDDLTTEEKPLPPDTVMRQIEAAIRVVNNLVAFQNNEQNREARDRMGTTLIMALQIPHQIQTPSGKANTHELYIAQVGDSRAYWLTPDYCQCLTVDDDVKTREVMTGRSLPREAARRSDAIALTQALGTRSGDYLHIKFQRFIIEEDGVMLLCSDGLSDSGMVERYGQSMANHVLRGKLPLNKAVGTWLKLADENNGNDNASVVLMKCRVSKPTLDLFNPSTAAQPAPQRSIQQETGQQETGQNEEAKKPAATSSAVGRSSPSKSTPHGKSRKKAASAKKTAAKPTKAHPFPGTHSLENTDAATEFRNVKADFRPVTAPSDQSPPPNSAKEHAHFSVQHSKVTSNSSPASDSTDELEQLAKTLLEPESQHPDLEHTEIFEEDEPDWNVFAVAIGLSVVMFITGAVGVFAWRQFAPANFNEHLQEAMDKLSEKFLEMLPSEAPPQESE